MVAGARGTGKTSLIKLFLDTSDFSSSATQEQKASVAAFLSKCRKGTRTIQKASIEITEARYDRILLTLIDTPGLRFGEGEELPLERSVYASSCVSSIFLFVLTRGSASLVKYFDNLYDETLGEEAKVVRQSKGDQHIHLCVYLVDPNSIVSSQARRPKQPLITRTRSQTNSSVAHGNGRSDAEYSDDEEGDENEAHLSMNPAELKVIKRLAARVNVLPVIARADELTESRLLAVKRTIKRELQALGLGFGVFAPVSSPQKGLETHVSIVQSDTEVEEEEDRESRPVIRIRSTKQSGERSRSRRRSRALDGSPVRAVDSDGEQTPVPNDHTHLHNNEHTHYAPQINRALIDALLPFALVSPQFSRHHHTSFGKDDSMLAAGSPGEQEIPGTPTSRRTSVPPSAFPAPYGHASADNDTPREFPKGKYVRKYKWGTLDVCDPAHCDFVVLRTAILSSYFKVRTIIVAYPDTSGTDYVDRP